LVGEISLASFKISAGLLMYRLGDGGWEVLLVHPGGPFWRTKDEGAWSIPKGVPETGEELLAAARREFEEETGWAAHGDFFALQPIRQTGGKVVHAWAFEGDCDPASIRSNTFTMQWPPNSGRQAEFPEIDRAEFFELETAREKINRGQIPLLDELAKRLEDC
jgi:predicted NUDIX family NTP pyrophosphohydrolase